jgi:pSer/pThr/pTyr-binding forkhead associated (FHA) protein
MVAMRPGDAIATLLPSKQSGFVDPYLISVAQGEAKMELKLIVLAGAKQGTEIPLKKDKFFIGRAKECNLRAGSEAISRRHCAITRSDGHWMVRDLGSRNGTHVNEIRIDKEVPLKVGDELRVGPLKFRVSSASVEQKIPIPPLAPPAETKQRKQPPVKDAAEAAQRTATKSDSHTSEDDISNWLLGIVDPAAEETMKETRTISLQETKTLNRLGQEVDAATAEQPTPADSSEEPMEADSESNGAAEKAEEKSGSWGFFKRGKGTGKKKPGKLPPRSDQQTKDSREAAADILREMTRRR